MLTPENLHAYQQRAVNHQCSHPETALWLDMGLGKSIITLTSVAHLLNTQFLNATLVVAPVRVCRLVWRQESLKWSQTKHLRFNMLLGDRDARTRALLRPADVYLINYENLGWLAEVLHTYFINKNRPLPFNGIVFDELSKLKNSTTGRVKSMMKVLPHFKWRTGLTGTPASNGFKDLHGQFLVLDGGKRLGVTKGEFDRRFLKKVSAFKSVNAEGTEHIIKQLIGDITLEMSAEDYLKLPDLIVNDIEVELPENVRAKYEQMEKDFFIRLDNGAEKEVFNQASLTNACLQISNGAMYPVAGMPMWEPVHDAKLEALDEIIEEANGKPILLAYAYRSDAERIMKRYAEIDPINLTDCKSESALQNAMTRWVTGRCQLMIGHPLSMGHGIDGLQKTGNIVVWFGLNWSLDSYDQMNARLRRQGQGHPVVCHRILCRDTLDQAQALALEEKATNQNSLRKAVRDYREKKFKK